MMPLNKDPKEGGTNTDGSISKIYCSCCYQNGEFTNPNISAKEMREFIVNKMVKMKYPRFIAKFMTARLPNLQRWKIINKQNI